MNYALPGVKSQHKCVLTNANAGLNIFCVSFHKFMYTTCVQEHMRARRWYQIP